MLKKNVDKILAQKKRNFWPINPVTKKIPNKKRNYNKKDRRSEIESAYLSN